MAASDSTTNYDLPIYQPDDHFSVLGDLNSAMETIDSEIAIISESTTGAAANAQAALTAAQAAQTAAGQAATSAQAASVSAAGASETASSAMSVASAARNDATSAAATAATASTDSANALAQAQQAVATATAARQDTEDGHSALARQTYLKEFVGEGSYTFTGADDTHISVTGTASNLTVGATYIVLATFEIRNQSEYEPEVDLSITVDGTRIGPLEVVASDSYYMGQSLIRAFKATSTSHTIRMVAKGRGSGAVNATMYDVDCYMQIV